MEIGILQKEITDFILKATENTGNRSYFEFNEIEIDNGVLVFVFHIDLEIDSENIIRNLNIYGNNSVIQFPDFEASIKEDYLRKLEEEINGTTLNY